MRVHWCVGLLLCLAWADHVNAQPQAQPRRPCWHDWCNWAPLCPPVGCCPDDYVRKPFPSLCPTPCCGGPDDYCRKPLPCVPAVPCCGGPDDYCRKPLPCLLCPPITPYLQCGPADGSCSTCGKRR
jgi:hypothetical protein